jgi:hypothetical protein
MRTLECLTKLVSCLGKLVSVAILALSGLYAAVLLACGLVLLIRGSDAGTPLLGTGLVLMLVVSCSANSILGRE